MVWVFLLLALATLALVQGASVSVSAQPMTLDYQVYRTRVEPILMAPREGNARCIACHSRGGGNSYLEPLAPGSTAYTEEQSRRNYERVQRLVVHGEPLRSPLLVNPLAESAGGSHWHGGGKHWDSQDDPEWQTLAAWVRTPGTGAPPVSPAPASPSPAAATAGLDYAFFRTRVQPILMAPREGNARCIACHSRGGGNSYLEPLAPGSTSYTDDQTRRNYERIQRLVVPGEPLRSPLLVNPLAESAGGSHWHGGGKHWDSQADPEWQTLAAWVAGTGR